MTPPVWYCPCTSSRVIPAHRRRRSTAQRSLSIFSCSVFTGPSDQFLHDSLMEFPVYARSANSGSFRG
jgi:Rieske Fe-S protein